MCPRNFTQVWKSVIYLGLLSGCLLKKIVDVYLILFVTVYDVYAEKAAGLIGTRSKLVFIIGYYYDFLSL